MERTELINYARIGIDLFLIIVIGIFIWQFYHADLLVRDIALYDAPEKLVMTYENITGLECVCGKDMRAKCLNINLLPDVIPES